MLYWPGDCAVAPNGDVIWGDRGTGTLRRYIASNQTVVRIVGDGVQASTGGDVGNGDGGPALSARLRFPTGIRIRENGVRACAVDPMLDALLDVFKAGLVLTKRLLVYPGSHSMCDPSIACRTHSCAVN